MTSKRASKDLQDFIAGIGIQVDNSGIPVELTPDVVEKVQKGVIGQIDKGIAAQRKLAEISNQDVSAELKAMGLEGKSEIVDTIQEFHDQPKGFVLADAIGTADMTSLYGHKIKTVQGGEYCMTANLYCAANQASKIFRPGRRMFADVYRPWNGQGLDMKTLFVWREGGIGDLIFIRPILCHIKTKWPTCRIIFATKSQYHPMVKMWGDCIDELEPVPFASSNTFDVSDYHLTFMGVIERIRLAEKIDVHDLFAEYAGLDPDEIDWCVPMPSTSSNLFFAAKPPAYAVVQPQSSASLRTQRTKTTIAAIDAITETGMQVVIADRSKWSRWIDDIRHMCKHPWLVINWGRFGGDIQDAVRLVSEAALVVAPDSSMVHIAAMQNVPCVALYGPFRAHCRTSRYPLCGVLETPESDCCEHGGRGCFKHSQDRCPYHEACWDLLDNDRLVEMIHAKLGYAHD